MKTGYYLLCRIRHGFLSGALIAVVIAVLSVFSFLYANNMERKKQELEDTYNNLPVEVVISNLSGTQTDSLNIPNHLANLFVANAYYYQGELQKLPFSAYTKDVALKSSLLYSGEDGQAMPLVGITTVSKEKALQPEEGIFLTFLDGEDDAFLQTDRECCIVPESIFQTLLPDENGLFYVEIFVRSSSNGPKLHKSLQVTGYYSGKNQTIYIPWKLSTQWLTELDGCYLVDSIRATIRDNRLIPEYNEILARHFEKVDPTASPKGNGGFAAEVLDEKLNSTVKNLKQNMETLSFLHPVVLCILFGISAVTCFFSCYVRKRELAGMRFLGVPARNVFALMIAETLIWTGAGSSIALLLQKCLSQYPSDILAAGGICVAAILGTAVSGCVVLQNIGINSLKEAE